MIVLVLPPNESCNSLVNLETLYGIWVFPSTKDDITLPSVESDKLILTAYLNLSPYALVFDCF